jgi:hypothetical protein
LPRPVSGASCHSLACGSITVLSASAFMWPSLYFGFLSSYENTSDWI